MSRTVRALTLVATSLAGCGRVGFDAIGDAGALDASDAGPTLVTAGLALRLDPGDLASYPGTGTLVTDLSARDNDGTLVGPVAFTAEAAGSYFTFDGADTTYLTLGTPTPTAWTFGKTPRTLSAWAYLAVNRPGYSLVMSYGTGVDGEGSYLGTSVDGTQWNFGGYFTNQYGGTVTTGAWVSLTGVWDGTTARLYLDDTLLSAAAQPNWNAIAGSEAKLGVDTAFSGEGWQGRLGLALYYERALTAAEVAQNFAATRARYGR